MEEVSADIIQYISEKIKDLATFEAIEVLTNLTLTTGDMLQEYYAAEAALTEES